jgi:competence protein ComEA
MVNRFLTTREQLVLAGLAAAIVIGSATIYFLRATPPAPGLANAAEVQPQVLPPIEELEEPPPQPMPAETAALPAPIAAPQPVVPVPDLVIAVEGEVYAPGVYRLKAGDRVEDAVDEAGGTTDEADLSDINLAAPLTDATTLHIPKRPYAGKDGEVLVLRRGPQAAAMNPPQYTRSGWRNARSSGPDTTQAMTPAAAPASPQESDDGLVNINTASQSELETLPEIGPVTAKKIIAHREAHPFTSVDDLQEVSGIGPKTLEAVKPFIKVQ